MRFPRLAPLTAASALLLSALGLAGCGSDSIGPSANSNSQVRSINALQGCGNVDIRQPNILPIPFGNMGYGAILPASGYIPVRAGTANYGVFLTGQNSNALATSSVALNPHDPGGNPNTGTYTLAATGACGPAPGVQSPQLVRLIDAFPFTFTGAAQGTVGIRVINLIPDFNGTISLFSNGAPLHGTDDAGTNAVPYAGSSGFDSSHYNSGINLAGNPPLTIQTNGNAQIATLPGGFSFQPNHAYTLFVIGEVNPASGGQAVSVEAALDF